MARLVIEAPRVQEIEGGRYVTKDEHDRIVSKLADALYWPNLRALQALEEAKQVIAPHPSYSKPDGAFSTALRERQERIEKLKEKYR